jgi:uncharacterized membrane protein SpoIIM required for sporulation
MSPHEFVRRFEPEWQALEDLAGEALAHPRAGLPGAAEFPARFRRVCQQLALARTRHYPPPIVQRLNRLALVAHQALYGTRGGPWPEVKRFALSEFPSLVRRHAGLFWAATCLLYLPAFIMSAVLWVQPEMIYSLMDPAQVRDFEAMYQPGRAYIGFKRASDTNVMMFGHYIRNNISIGFQEFAGGLVLGLGTVASLVFNGLYFGAVATHITRVGYAEPFFQFVAGHSAFELTAISLTGKAGLMLGQALLAPGRLTRRAALVENAEVAVRIVYGAAAMLLIAAFLEAFWSSTTAVPPLPKYLVGIALWVLVGAYFLFMGRRAH